MHRIASLSIFTGTTIYFLASFNHISTIGGYSFSMTVHQTVLK
jgi:hypothetical protein